MLPYEAREKFLTKYRGIKKHLRDNSVFVDRLINDIIDWGAQGVLITDDYGNVSLQNAERYRFEYFLPLLYDFANKEPALRGEALRYHLDNLAGRGENKLSNQDFFKLLSILDTITRLVELYLRNLSGFRSIDIRSLKLIIDDQCKAVITTFQRGFIGYFLNCRARDGRFSLPPSCAEFRRLYTWKKGNLIFLDANKLLKNIVLDDNKKMVDRYPELMIADILAVTTTRLLRGDSKISKEIADKALLHKCPNGHLCRIYSHSSVLPCY